MLDPRDLGFERPDLEGLLGGTPQENAAITRHILSGEDRGPRRDVVLLNSGMALYVGSKADTLTEGISQAADSIDSGIALEKLSTLVDFTQSFASN